METMPRLWKRGFCLGCIGKPRKGQQEAQNLLKNIVGSYLYKDVLQYQDIKIQKCWINFAGSRSRLAMKSHIMNIPNSRRGKGTAANYIQILEKAFIVLGLAHLAETCAPNKKCVKFIFLQVFAILLIISTVKSADRHRRLVENFDE